MIDKTHRFHGRSSLRFVYSKGESVRGSCCSLKFARNRLPNYRLAVVVSRKVSKSAVVRNRIRRRIYEIIRQLHITGNYDMVLTVYSDQLAQMPADQLQNTITEQLIRARIVGQPAEPPQSML